MMNTYIHTSHSTEGLERLRKDILLDASRDADARLKAVNAALAAPSPLQQHFAPRESTCTSS
jgi:hypothetical protein